MNVLALHFVLLYTNIICFVNSLYDDQIGKFDWLQRYVGKINYAVFDELSQSRKIIVSSHQNVIAALSTKNGDILWRHVLESSEAGKVEFISVENEQVKVLTSNLFRIWDAYSAVLIDEILLDYTVSSGTLDKLVMLYRNEFTMIDVLEGSLQISVFDITSGKILDENTVAAPWLQKTTKCIVLSQDIMCMEISSGFIFLLNLQASELEFSSAPISSFGFTVEISNSLHVGNIPGSTNYCYIKVNNIQKLLHLDDGLLHVVQDISNIKAVAIVNDTLFSILQNGMVVTVSSENLKTGEALIEQEMIVELPPQSGTVENLVVYVFEKRDGAKAARAFVTCSDHSIHMLSNTGLMWSRQEALSSVLVAEAVDLPSAEVGFSFLEDDVAYSGVLSCLWQRIKAQCGQLNMWLRSFFTATGSYQSLSSTLTRDFFNIRKLLIVVTEGGKIFGIDSWNGDIVWSVYIPHLYPISSGKFFLFIQRTSSHFPLEPQCMIVGKHKDTDNGLLFIFNPITGLSEGEIGKVVLLNYKIIQASVLHHMDRHYLKPVLLIDSALTPHVYPMSGESLILENKDSMYVHLAFPNSSHFRGYAFRYSKPGSWSVSLTGGFIIGIHGKLPNEKVHSPGRVLADRSVLYKYINPNLVVVVTQGYDNINKNTLTVHLVDTVTGAVLDSLLHKRVSGRVHVVHSENWIVYCSFNEKYRRNEITTLELFEGFKQANATAFTSFGADGTTLPLLEKQAFIMPQGIQAASQTHTEKGITTKFLLFALQSGSVLQISKWFLDPRRPQSQAGYKEEGLIPYMPELPLPPQEMITYNHSLPRISGIYTAGTGLESTCIVLVYGLDVFFTRVFPSKTFDVLKDDFDHYLISGALLTMVFAAIVMKRLAQHKLLSQAWK